MIGPDMDSQGGISSVISLYKNHGLDVSNLSSYKDGNTFEKLFFYFVFLIKYIFVLLTNKNLELIHIHTASRGSFLRKALALKIAKLFHKKVILHLHGAEFLVFFTQSPDLLKKIIKTTFDHCDLIIVLSKQWENIISGISTNKNIKVLYNPTVIKEFDRVQSEQTKVIFMGRLGKRKGIYDIIEAAKTLKSNNVVIELYGDGDIEKFKTLIEENNLQEKVKLMGWISGSQKDDALQNSDIYILPSYNEGLPMSILEALAVGLPVISTPVGGIPEAVEDGINGFLVEAGDSAMLAEKIDLLTSDRALRDKMGEQGYRFAKEKFDIKIIINQLQEIYGELLR